MQAHLKIIRRLLKKKNPIYAFVAFLVTFALVNQFIIHWISQNHEDQKNLKANNDVLEQLVSEIYYFTNFQIQLKTSR